MKKLLVAVVVALIGWGGTVPSFAFENQFGGAWSLSMYRQGDFDGDAASTYDEDDVAQADSQTRIYYTAIINENLKFVNKFEVDILWGGQDTPGTNDSAGDIGADGISVEVKNSYVDFTMGSVNTKIGTQAATIHRGFVFDDDFSGIIVTTGMVTGLYAKIVEGGDGMGDDQALYHLSASYELGNVTLVPALTYIDLDEDRNLYFLGLDVDVTFDKGSLWGTFIYNGGDLGGNVDLSAWLAAAGFDMTVTGMFSFHGQAFYATGDDDDTDANDFGASTSFGWYGQSYYWAEIMGYGLFDYQASANSPADAISNITAINLGITVAPTDKLTCTLDVWYAVLNEEIQAGLDESLGTEIDFFISYELIEDLYLDFAAAYLFAGDSTTSGAADSKNPYEIGTMLSLSF